MKSKKQFLPIFFIILILCVLYVIFAARPLGTEYQFEPDWKITVSNPTVSEKMPDDTPLYFKLGKTLGYFTEDGRVTHFSSFSYKASISQNYYTCYNENNVNSDFFTADGTRAGTIRASGFPMISDDRIFVFLPGGSAFVQCDNTGKKLWEYSGTVPITAFDSSSGGCVAGFVDGSVYAFDPNGNVVQRFSPGGSNYPVILGAAISEDASLVAVVSGQMRQRFVLVRNDGVSSKIIFHEFLEDSDSFQRMVRFYDGDRKVVYSSGNMLGIVSTEGGKSRHIHIKGQAIDMQEAGNLIFVLLKEKKMYTVHIIEHFATLSGSFTFEADNAFIRTSGNNLYIGKDNTISKIHITKK